MIKNLLITIVFSVLLIVLSACGNSSPRQDVSNYDKNMKVTVEPLNVQESRQEDVSKLDKNNKLMPLFILPDYDEKYHDNAYQIINSKLLSTNIDLSVGISMTGHTTYYIDSVNHAAAKKIITDLVQHGQLKNDPLVK